MLTFRSLLPAAGLCTLLPTLSAQGNTLHLQIDGAAAGDHFGHAIIGLADINGDGFGDLAVSAPLASPGGLAQAGSVYVHSGADGTLLYRLDGEAAGDQFGFALANLGDTNGDGVDDFTVGAPFVDIYNKTDNGSTYTYSGADGTLLRRFNGGYNDGQHGFSVSGIGDVDGDGNADLLTTEPGYMPSFGTEPRGKISVHSIFPSATVQALERRSDHVVGLGDINGDGIPEYLSDGIGSWTHGGLRVRRGDDSNYLYEVKVKRKSRFWGGGAFSAIEDLDADGFPDFILGYPSYDEPHQAGGHVAVHSGLNGRILFAFEGTQVDGLLGSNVHGLGDLDSDGVADFLAVSGDLGSPGTSITLQAFSGADASQVFLLTGSDGFGSSLCGLPDVDGDGLTDWGAGSPLASPNGLAEAGSIYLYR